MSRGGRVLFVLGVLALAGALFGAFHALYDRVERTEKTPPTGRAAVDPYYALELVLERYGLEVISDAGDLAAIDRAEAVFWLADEPPGWEIWSFYFGGGFVVVEGRHVEAWAEDGVLPSVPESGPGPAGLAFIAEDEANGAIATLPEVTVFSSERLGQEGHAEALAAILGAIEPGSAVMIVRRTARTHLLQLIFGRGLPFVVVLLASLVLLGRRSALRFGPVRAAPEPGRRSFVEHLEAVGHFVRRHGGEDELVESARAEVLERFIRRMPELAGLSRAALVDRLLEHVTLDRETLERALVDSPRGHPRAFVDFVNALQELRKSP
jgi:hypothetical protein